MPKNKEYAVLFKKVIEEGHTLYIPFDVVKGEYNENDECFYVKEKDYEHIIYNKDLGYGYLENVTNLINKYPLIPFQLAKKIILSKFNKYNFIRSKDKNNVPIIMATYDNSFSEENLVIDDIILEYYRKYFPNALITSSDLNSVTPKNKIDIDVKSLYDKLTEKIIGQDDKIKEILTIIWKEYNNYSEDIPRNILINGDENTPKKEIFEIIKENIQIPVEISSTINYYKNGIGFKTAQDILSELITIANGDIEKAERGIIVIDDLDLIGIENADEVNKIKSQIDILKLLNGEAFTVNYNGKKISFDTNNLLIVLMGSFYKYYKNNTVISGFGKDNFNNEDTIEREEYVNEGILPEVISSTQTIIELNKPCLENYIELLNNDTNALTLTKKLLENFNIKLNISDEVVNLIAEKASKNKYGIYSLDEIVENIFKEAYFEIVCNPNLYDELIITPEIVKDNKKYTLTRKRDN